MWVNLSNKAVFSIIAGTSVLFGGSGILIHNLSNAKTLKDLILSKSFTLLNDNNNDEWNRVLEDYTEQIKSKKELKINNFEGGTQKIEEFKKECKNILNLKYRVALNKKLVNQALWCVKEQKISEYLKKNKFTIFRSISSDNQLDKAKWDEKIKKYLTIENKEKIPNLVIEKSKHENIDEGERNNFIKACEKLKQLKHFNEKFVDSYNLASAWCAEKSNDS